MIAGYDTDDRLHQMAKELVAEVLAEPRGAWWLLDGQEEFGLLARGRSVGVEDDRRYFHALGFDIVSAHDVHFVEEALPSGRVLIDKPAPGLRYAPDVSRLPRPMPRDRDHVGPGERFLGVKIGVVPEHGPTAARMTLAVDDARHMLIGIDLLDVARDIGHKRLRELLPGRARMPANGVVTFVTMEEVARWSAAAGLAEWTGRGGTEAGQRLLVHFEDEVFPRGGAASFYQDSTTERPVIHFDWN